MEFHKKLNEEHLQRLKSEIEKKGCFVGKKRGTDSKRKGPGRGKD
jgi:hypothetical protein